MTFLLDLFLSLMRTGWPHQPNQPGGVEDPEG